MLGDTRSGDSRRFNFNCLLHLSLLGSICYLVAGFGWPRTVDINPDKFKRPRTYTFLTRFAGPFANLLLAGIAGSISSIMEAVEYDARVFLMVIGVSITTAVYNLILLPPLAGGVLVQELIPPGWATLRKIFGLAGPFLILALVLLERLYPPGIVGPYLNPIILAIFKYIRA
jgi:Zn-dependent protease